MTSKVEIWGIDRQGLSEADGPEEILSMSPLWARDIQRLGPWIRKHLPGIDQADGDTVWTAAQAGESVSGYAGAIARILVCRRCASTMDTAWHFIETGRMQTWDSVLAVEQAAGRGQHERQWVSPAGNIHASWCWPMPDHTCSETPAWKNLMSLAAGFILAQALRKFDVPVEIKWPNDLLIDDRKFGGILIEIRGAHILLGCGINLAFAPEDRLLRDQFAVSATHLFREGFNFTPLALWMTLVTEGKALFEAMVYGTKPAEFIKMINDRMIWVGKKVAVRGMHNDVFEAVILGLSPDGGLRIKKGRTDRVIYSGSIIPA